MKNILSTYILWSDTIENDNGTVPVRIRYTDGSLSEEKSVSSEEISGVVVCVVPSVHFSVVTLEHTFNTSILPAIPSLIKDKILHSVKDIKYTGFKNTLGKTSVAIVKADYIEKCHHWAEQNSIVLSGIMPEDAVYGQQSEYFTNIAEITFSEFSSPSLNKKNTSVLSKIQSLRYNSPVFITGVIIGVMTIGILSVSLYSKSRYTLHQSAQKAYVALIQKPYPKSSADTITALNTVIETGGKLQDITSITTLNTIAGFIRQEGQILLYSYQNNRITLRVQFFKEDGSQQIIESLKSSILELDSFEKETDILYTFVYKNSKQERNKP